jgi:hypothetical protein
VRLLGSVLYDNCDRCGAESAGFGHDCELCEACAAEDDRRRIAAALAGCLTRVEMPDDELMRLPPGYHLDVVSRPGLIVLCRENGSFVAAFSAYGFTKEEIEEAARNDLADREPGVE